MGLRTQLCLSWDDSNYTKGSLEVDHVIDAAGVFVTGQNWSQDVLTDLRNSCASDSLGEPGFNSVMSVGVIELIRSVSQRFPQVTFYAKGAGEEFWDIWTREFLSGVEQRGHGPFEEDVAPLPEDLIAQAKAAYAAAADRKVSIEKSDKTGWFSKLFR